VLYKLSDCQRGGRRDGLGRISLLPILSGYFRALALVSSLTVPRITFFLDPSSLRQRNTQTSGLFFLLSVVKEPDWKLARLCLIFMLPLFLVEAA